MLRTIPLRPHLLRLQRLFNTLPEHSPAQSDNEAWLDSLDDSIDAPEIPSEFHHHSKVSHSSYRILRDHQNGEYDIALQFTNKDLYSSPFSQMKHRSRPKAEAQGFTDVRILKLRSGKGGDGCVSFFRDSGHAIGPPDGGDGGRGGNIYIQALEGLTSLNKLRQTYIAGDAQMGKARQLDGSNGKDIIITVPVGTVIKWLPDPVKLKEALEGSDALEVEMGAVEGRSYEPGFIQLKRDSYDAGQGWIFKDKEKDEAWHRSKQHFVKLDKKVQRYDNKIIREEQQGDLFPINGIDLDKPTPTPMLLLRGGVGGLGNMHFLTNDIRNPRFAKSGRSNLESHFLFELKLLADLGLVGLPNAGKSTLLRAVSNATPRVGHWEFTTLQPSIGTIPLGVDKESFTVADIPGIIKGASQNKGMGMDFLRHVERSGGLVFVISLGNKDPINDLNILLGELGDRVEGKRMLIVATKADVEGSHDKFKALRQYVENKEWKIVPVCAQRKENIEQLILMMGECAGKL
jgi:Obg family GTPase CgtA